MKFLIFTNIILFSFLFNSCESISEKELKSNLMDNVENYCEGVRNSDAKKLSRYFPESMIESMGGYEVFNEQLENTKELLIENGTSYGSIKFSNPEKFLQKGNYVHAIVPIETRIHTSENNVTSNSFLYCLSENNGASWVIMEYKSIKETFPDFQYEFHPESHASIKEDSCNYYKIDVFGYSICVDRFIESGEYEVNDKHDGFASRLTKSTKPNPLTSQRLDLIDKAIIEWKTQIKVKCEFPKISNETVVYLESDIGRFYLYDVYGIPFTYLSSNETVKDTLPGCFKLEHAKAFQSLENINKMNSKKDVFEVLYDVSDF